MVCGSWGALHYHLLSNRALLIRLSLNKKCLGFELPSWLCPTSATCKTDNEINRVNPSCVPSLLPFCAQLIFPGARAAVRTGFVPQLGAIGPVSPLLAGHSCDEAGQLNSVGFHEEAEREAGLRCTQKVGGGWVCGTWSTEPLIPCNYSNRPTGMPSPVQ